MATNKSMSAAPLSISPNPKKTLLKRELFRLGVLTGCAVLFLALVSYQPNDPSFHSWSTQNHIHNWMGRSGSVIADLFFQGFGLAAFGVVALMGALAFRVCIFSADHKKSVALVIGLFFLISLSLVLQTTIRPDWLPLGLRNAGGVVGDMGLNVVQYALGTVGAILLSYCLFIAATILTLQWNVLSSLYRTLLMAITISRRTIVSTYPKVKNFFSRSIHIINFQLSKIGHRLKERFREWQAKRHTQTTKEDSEPIIVETPAAPVSSGADKRDIEELQTISEPQPKEKWKPSTNADRKHRLPPLSLLSSKPPGRAQPTAESWYKEKGDILKEKLNDFGVEGEIVNISPGPVITVYEFKPASGVKIREIANLSDDLTLALSVLSVRIVAPIPGKPVVGIEIPTPQRETVYFKELISETGFLKSELKIPLLLGRLASGEPVKADLAAMPHLLVAGATGTGKSVFVNTLIHSLLYRFHPNQLRMILVDPKMVELSHFEGIPHLLLPVIVDSKKAAAALRWAVDEMERRYLLMHEAGVRHIDAYNSRVTELLKKDHTQDYSTLPYIVVIIDEYADLMAVVPKDVELSITRLAQKARASGIHLILATQRPSTDVVTGTIKANFPSRISFRVASSVDSKTILDRTGSERLLGNGDLLFHSSGFTTLKRMQGPFISDEDIERVVDYLKSQGTPDYNENLLAATDVEENASGMGDKESDELYDKAVFLVTEKGEASISLIQRHLRIGYNRAATLMEQLEENGVVGPSTPGTKRRTVLASPT